MIKKHLVEGALIVFSVLAAADDTSYTDTKKNRDLLTPIAQATDTAVEAAPYYAIDASEKTAVDKITKNSWLIDLGNLEPVPARLAHRSELSLLKLRTPSISLQLGLGKQHQADAALPNSLQSTPKDAGFVQNQTQEVFSLQFNF